MKEKDWYVRRVSWDFTVALLKIYRLSLCWEVMETDKLFSTYFKKFKTSMKYNNATTHWLLH